MRSIRAKTLSWINLKMGVELDAAHYLEYFKV